MSTETTPATVKKTAAPKPEKPSFEERNALCLKVAEAIRSVTPNQRLTESKQKALAKTRDGIANYAEALAYVGQK